MHFSIFIFCFIVFFSTANSSATPAENECGDNSRKCGSSTTWCGHSKLAGSGAHHLEITWENMLYHRAVKATSPPTAPRTQCTLAFPHPSHALCITSGTMIHLHRGSYLSVIYWLPWMFLSLSILFWVFFAEKPEKVILLCAHMTNKDLTLDLKCFYGGPMGKNLYIYHRVQMYVSKTKAFCLFSKRPKYIWTYNL